MKRENEWIGRLADRSLTTFLVRDVLGCSCPQEVFDHYQVRSVSSEDIPAVQVVMGRRLLIRIVDAEKMDMPEKKAMELLAQGAEERNRRGLNRFRLLIIGGFSPDRIEELERLPERLGPRVHLHVLSGLEGMAAEGTG
jgi:hypothetical protein